MRLCLVVPGIGSGGEDSCTPAMTDLIRRLAESHSVTVISLRHPRRDARDWADGVLVRSLGGGGKRGLRRLVLLERAVAAVRREHHSDPFDLVHGLGSDEAGTVAKIAGRLLGVPSLVSARDSELGSTLSDGHPDEESLDRCVRRLEASYSSLICGR